MGERKIPSVDQYLQVLRGETIQSALRQQRLPVAFLASCIETGVVDCHDKVLLAELERSLGRTIRPVTPPSIDSAEAARRVSSTAGMPVVGGTGSGVPPFLQGSLPPQEMLRQSVAEMDARIAASEVLQKKDFCGGILHAARRVWCTPELMRTLVADHSYIDRLRAAMYPLLVSYCERIFEKDGRWYAVPYITIPQMDNKNGEQILRKGDDEKDFRYEGRSLPYSTTFLLGPKGGIGSMTGTETHLYDPADFASPEAIKRYMGELKTASDNHVREHVFASSAKKRYKQDWKKVESYLEPYASGREPIGDPESFMKRFAKFHKNEVLGCDTENDFVNVKTGERFYATIRHNRKESRKYGPEWYKVLDITACMDGEVLDRSRIPGEFERQRPGSVRRDRAVADESLRRLNARMLKTDGLEKIAGWYYEPDGQEEFEKYDYEIL